MNTGLYWLLSDCIIPLIAIFVTAFLFVWIKYSRRNSSAGIMLACGSYLVAVTTCSYGCLVFLKALLHLFDLRVLLGDWYFAPIAMWRLGASALLCALIVWQVSGIEASVSKGSSETTAAP
jgi:hypothetical protein